MTCNNLSPPPSPRRSPQLPEHCANVFALLSKQRLYGKGMTRKRDGKEQMSEEDLERSDAPCSKWSLFRKTLHNFLLSNQDFMTSRVLSAISPCM